MRAPTTAAEAHDRKSAALFACLAAAITLVFGSAFFGLSSFRWPFAAILIVGAASGALYAFLMWRVAITWPGPLATGALAPLIGLFVADVLQSVHAGYGDGLSGSVLFGFWPIAVFAALAGLAAALLTLFMAKRRSA